MHNLDGIFTRNNFELTKETSKAKEYENLNTKQVVYLIPARDINVILNPSLVEKNVGLESKSKGKYHNTALKQFPKRKNKGKQPIHYGYSFKFVREGEFDAFLTDLDKM